MAIYDTMQYAPCDVATYGMGLAASMGQFLLTAALPNARVLIHQPATQGTQGQVSDLEIQAAEIERMRRLMEETLSRHTGKTAEQVREDTDRDKFLTAQEAKDYGIIDQVFEYRKLSAQ
jgi:ATP-dependent Clp protease protease subunit